MSKQSMRDELRREILSSLASQAQIAAGAKCSQSTISRIANGGVGAIHLETYERIMAYLKSIQRIKKSGRRKGAGGAESA